MIRHRVRTPADAERDFLEWASLFSHGVIVHIIVYADESETQETGVHTETLVSGLMALRADWMPFCARWQIVLNKYNVTYFHFREWADASAVARNTRQATSKFAKNPYRGWDSKRLDDFVRELAAIAFDGNKLTCGVIIPILKFQEAKLRGAVRPEADALKGGLEAFFDSYLHVIEKQRRPWKRQPVSFVFDQNQKREWLGAVLGEYAAFKERHRKCEGITFGDKMELLPLQAADMLAYRARQLTVRKDGEDVYGDWPVIDRAIIKMFPQSPL